MSILHPLAKLYKKIICMLIFGLHQGLATYGTLATRSMPNNFKWQAEASCFTY